MPIPPWAIELLRRSVSDVASKTSPETIDRIRTQATSILNDIPAAAAKTVDSVMSATESRRDAVRQWAKTYTSKSREVINGSGVLIDPPAPIGEATPNGETAFAGNNVAPFSPGTTIDADVLEAGMEFFDGGRVAGPGLARWCDSLLPKITGGTSLGEPVAMTIIDRFHAAVAMIPTLSPLSLSLHRSQAVALPGGGNVPDLVSSLGFSFEEFGSIGGPQISDYAGRPPTSTVFVGNPPAERMVGQGIRIDVLPVALASSCEIDVPTISRSFASGADVVIAAIGGLIGGPDTGVIVGRASAIDRLRCHRLSKLFQADIASVAMTLAALSRNPGDVADSAVSRMQLSIENLQSRAERISTRLMGTDAPIQTRITEEPAFVAGGMFPVPSRQIAVSIEGQSGQSVSETFRNRDPSVLTQTINHEAIIDLRWISPGQDAGIEIT